MDANPQSFFKKNSWFDIKPMDGGRNVNLKYAKDRSIHIESFYVRKVAVWVPHLIVPNHVPTCPKCCSKQFVNVNKVKWVDYPKLCYGLSDHYYIDTVFYRCDSHACRKSFCGYNPEMLRLDANKVFAEFGMRFKLRKTFAVDEQLFQDVMNDSLRVSTADTAKRIHDNYQSTYRAAMSAMFQANALKKIKHAGVDGRSTFGQGTLDRHLTVMPRQTKSQKQLSSLEDMLRTKKRNFDLLDNALNDPLDFARLLDRKQPRNDRHLSLPHLGEAKLGKYMRMGIMNARELIDNYSGPSGPVKLRHVEVCEAHYAGIRKQMKKAKAEYKVVKRQVKKAREEVMLEDSFDFINNAPAETWDYDPNAPDEEEEEKEEEQEEFKEEEKEEPPPSKPPPFSKIDDCTKYNGRFFSKARLDGLVNEEFVNRKAVQDNKMRGIGAECLSIDFLYRPAAKVRVYTGRGVSFRPYKCLLTIQQEDGLTIFWKGLHGSESFAEVDRDLAALAKRLSALGSTVKVIYVDNCCGVCTVLKRHFPQAQVKLDAFHWLKRWDDMLCEPTSPHAGVFRGLMSRALFNITPGEYERAKDVLEGKLNRPPSNKEVIAEANSVIPGPEALRANVLAVLNYVALKDIEADLRRASQQSNSDSVIIKKFTKPVASDSIQKLISNQLKHVDKGCLSDPPPDVFNVHR